MTMKDEGVCRFCLKTFAGRSIGRHLTACKAKKQRDLEDTKGKNPRMLYHLKLMSYKPYWLHIELPVTAKLSELDRFLRQIWLECCGHLSEFTINGVRYSANEDSGDWWGTESKSINVHLKKVLGVKEQFVYEYDFGSTTEVVGQVYAQRAGVLKDKIRILARNTAPTFDCAKCSSEATVYCVECDAFYCAGCLSGHGCGEEMALPVVNSPRMGVCGYDGYGDFDGFDPEKSV